MSTRTKRRLNKTADILEGLVMFGLKALATALELVAIDFAFGKSRYRKRGSRPRPIIHRTYNRTIVVRSALPSERVMPPKYQR